jgi:hypothetical protein
VPAALLAKQRHAELAERDQHVIALQPFEQDFAGAVDVIAEAN